MVERDDILSKEKEYMVPAYDRKEIVVHKGKGTLVWDLDGTEYIDCFSGISVVNAGHSPDRLVKAGSEQLSLLFHCSGLYHSVPQTLLAEKLAGLTPQHLKKSFFCNSGAEAVEGAVKIAKKYSLTQGRIGAAVITLEGSFHGRLGLSLTLTGQAKYKRGLGAFANTPGVVHAPMPYCYRCPSAYPDCGIECARRIEDIIDYHTTGNVAAMIVEPILGEGGIVVPPDEYHAMVQKICRAHDILYIADEVQTGIGRTGRMFAIELFGISPDIMSMAKGLGAGLPIGGFITTDEIAGSLVSGDHFSTFGGNPVCCRVAAENLDYLIEDGLVKNSAKIGEKMMKHLLELQESHEAIGEVRGKGLMIGVELVKDAGTKEPAVEQTQSVAKRMVKNGALVGTGGVKRNVIRIQPPLCLTEEQSERVLTLLEAALRPH